MGILMVGLPMCAAIKTVCLNMTGFWLPVLPLLFLCLSLFGLIGKRKTLVLQASAKAFPIGADSPIVARCFGYCKVLMLMPHIAAKVVPGFAFDVSRH